MKSGTVRDPKSLVAYSLKDSISQRLIDGYSAVFTAPTSPHMSTLLDAITEGELDAHGNWVCQSEADCDVKTLTLEEGLTQGYIQLLSPREPLDVTSVVTKTVSVQHVIHPVSMRKISYSTAMADSKFVTAPQVSSI